MNTCLICKRMEMIEKNTNMFFLKEFKESYAVFADHQQFHGTIYLYCKQHVQHIDELSSQQQVTFLKEAIAVSKAMRIGLKADHVDLEMIQNSDHHVYIQLYPRYDQDLPLYGDHGNGPVYWCPKQVMFGSDNVPSANALNTLKSLILPYLEEVE